MIKIMSLTLAMALPLVTADLYAAEPAEPGLLTLNQVPSQGFLTFEGGVALTQNTMIHDSEGSTKFSFDTGLRFDLK